MTATVYTLYGDSFNIGVDYIPAYIAEMKARKGVADIDYCESVEYSDNGRASMLINGRGEVVAEFVYEN